MPIVKSSRKGERGKKDAKRHREKQKEVIRKKLPEIVSNENIITRRKGKKVKVPIKGVIIPDFRPGRRNKEKDGGGSVGVGQGSGSPGDVIGRKPGSGQGSGSGDNPGEDFIESEIDIEEIIEMIYEDIGLPNLQDKDSSDMEIFSGLQLKGVTRDGPQSLEFTEKISRNALGRFWSYMEILKSETGRDDIECFDALKETGGLLGESLELLQQSDFVSSSEEIEPFPIFDEEDMRYHEMQDNVEHHSNAVVFIELDISFSMTEEKKYLARSMMFWMVEFLRQIYDNVEVKFVVYHNRAKLVSEYDAFHMASTGGTVVHSAHELVIDQIQSKYPKNKWNSYVFQFSDGADFRSSLAVKDMEYMFTELGINMFGYSEVVVDSLGSSEPLFDVFSDSFSGDYSTDESENYLELFISDVEDHPLVSSRIRHRAHIWPVIQEFLKKDRRFYE